jgi:hypothetical protein
LTAHVILTDLEVTRRKVEHELELWDQQVTSYSRRGWIMLRREPPVLDVAFLARLQVGATVVTAIAAEQVEQAILVLCSRPGSR